MTVSKPSGRSSGNQEQGPSKKVPVPTIQTMLEDDWIRYAPESDMTALEAGNIAMFVAMISSGRARDLLRELRIERHFVIRPTRAAAT